jgi:hypothetical protein
MLSNSTCTATERAGVLGAPDAGQEPQRGAKVARGVRGAGGHGGGRPHLGGASQSSI